MPDEAPLSPATLAVSAGRPSREPGAPLSAPLVWSSTYVADGPVDYGRGGNPTWSAFEEALGELERGGPDGRDPGLAKVFGSGMAAVAAAVSLVPDGSVVVAPSAPYSGTRALLRSEAARGRLELREVDIVDTAAVTAALDGTAMLWAETPTNPMLEVADLPALVTAAHDAGALVVVDNTFSTPLVQRPLELGADLVVHSATKYLAGHSDVLLGATVTSDPELDVRVDVQRRLTGGIAGPAECWLALRGLRTLALRLQRAQANAAELARRLHEAGHSALAEVRHPSLPSDPGHARATAQMRGYGAVVSLVVAGADEEAAALRAERFAAATRLWVHTTSLGGVESTLERRRRHALEAPAVPAGLVRLSVGVEDVEDLWTDLRRALDAC